MAAADTTTIMLQTSQDMRIQTLADQERFEKRRRVDQERHQKRMQEHRYEMRRMELLFRAGYFARAGTLEESKPEYETMGPDPEESENDLEEYNPVESDPEEYKPVRRSSSR